MQYAIEVSDLSKHFGDFKAVDGLSFNVKKGEIYGFLGPNGSGKSTTLRMMTGLIRPDHGTIQILNKPIDVNNRQQIGAIIEKPDFYGYMSGIENLEMLAKLSGLKFSNKDLRELIHSVGLTGREHTKVKAYSHGMKQRLGIAQAIMHQPDIIILDEPNTGLDPQGIIDLREMILHLNKDQGKTILFSSHILSEVQEICHAMLIIHKGKCVVQGEVQSLISRDDMLVTIETSRNDLAMQVLTNEMHLICESGSIENTFQCNMRKNQIDDMIQLLHKNEIALFRVDYRNQLEAYFLQITKEAA